MKVWTCTTFTGHWPVGAAAVVVSDYATDAADLLNAELRRIGLPGDAEARDMTEVYTEAERAIVLVDGDY